MIYSLLAIFTGMVLVFTTTVNSRIGALKSVYKSSFINFLVGFIISVIILILFGNTISSSIELNEYYIFLGGAFAGIIVVISNYIITKIGIFFATLLGVTGQLLMGTIIDWVTYKRFPIWSSIGGAFIIAGLVYIHIIEIKQKLVKN